ncbi:MAG: hypothetical protein QOF13_161 [Solirubrobacterales bacterium]|nr:hypothetical protein [Solirubrobacterales bacterium]
MLLRLRRASLALLALIGAVGLGLVIFISQLGWPAVLSGPLPIGPTKVGRVQDGVALTRPAPQGRPDAGRQSGVSAAAVTQGARQRSSRGSGESRLGHSHELASTPSAPSNPGVGASPTPSPSPPASEPTPVVSTPAPSSPTTASVEGTATTTGASKASNDSSRAAGLAGAKSQGQLSATGKDSSPSTSKSSELASAKAHRDESTAAPVAPTSGVPAASSPAAAKEAADAAKASQGRH